MRIKLLLPFLLLLLIVCSSFTFNFNQPEDPLRNFARKYRSLEESTTISLGSLVMDIGSIFVEDREAATILRKISHVRVVTLEDATLVEEADVKRLYDQAVRQGFEELIKVRDGGEEVHVMMREKNDIIRGLLVMVYDQEGNEFTAVSVKGRVTFEQLQQTDFWKDLVE